MKYQEKNLRGKKKNSWYRASQYMSTCVCSVRWGRYEYGASLSAGCWPGGGVISSRYKLARAWPGPRRTCTLERVRQLVGCARGAGGVSIARGSVNESIYERLARSTRRQDGSSDAAVWLPTLQHLGVLRAVVLPCCWPAVGSTAALGKARLLTLVGRTALCLCGQCSAATEAL